MATGFKGNYMVLTPIAPPSVPNGSVFIDSTNANAASIKDTGGIVTPINAASTNIFIKQMQSDGVISINRPVSKKANGRVVAADSDSATGQDYCGFALQAAAGAGVLINVLCVGANLQGAVTGLGFAPGDEVYLSETGSGFTNNPASFTGGDDSIIKVGIADCAAGVASVTAVDLIVFSEVVARP